MQLSSMTRKFHQRRLANMSNYTDRFELSNEAQQAAAQITKGLMDKARRERRIPAKYQFWQKTNAPEIVEELTAAGFMTYKFDDNGVAIYEHEVDAESLRQALGWTAH